MGENETDQPTQPTQPDDGVYLIPPPFPTTPLKPTPLPRPPQQHHPAPPAAPSSLSREQLMQRLQSAEAQLSSWRAAASDLLAALALSPEMTHFVYARSLRAILSSALLSLDSVETLRHLECSMPTLSKEAPLVDLLHWNGLQFSEWRVHWAPQSWWVSVSADGSRWGLAFNCLANVSAIRMRGRIQCALSPDLSSIRIRFAEKPDLNMNVDTSVGWGIVPVPVQESIAKLIRHEIDAFIRTRLCNPDGMVIVLRRRFMSPSLSETDISEAISQAVRANGVRLRASTFF